MESMIFYRSFYDSMEELDDASRLALYDAIIRFGLYDEEPSLTGITKNFFTIMRPLIEANKTRAVNGKKGGRPRKKPMVSENENHRFQITKTNGSEISKPNKNYNSNSNSNLHHHVDEKTVSQNKTPLTEEEKERLQKRAADFIASHRSG